MNHLAHVWLAGEDPEAIVGAVLGDFWRGPPDPSWSPRLAAGVQLHRRIDRLTDAHPAVVDARGLFDPPLRRYAGVLLDVWFDHRLAATWERWEPAPLPEFAARIDATLATAPATLPDDFHRYRRRMAEIGGWAAYRQRPHVDRVLARLGHGSRFAHPLADAGAALDARGEALEAVFLRLLPDLRAALAAEPSNG